MQPTLYPTRVRLPAAYEEEAIMVLCRELHAENGIFKFADTKVRGYLHRAFEQKGGFLGVIGPPDELQAMIYLQIGSFWYTEEPCLEEFFTYVRPQFRKSRNALELLHFAKWCAESSNLPLFIGIVSSKQMERKFQLYQRQFSNPAGNFFLYNAEALLR